MSVQSQIERISAAVADSYTAAADIGATIPQTQTVDNLPETIRSIPTGGIKLQSIAVTTPPTKTSYLSGERFDPAGMVVTATYSNGAKLAATGYAIEPSGPLSDGVTSVTIRYTEGGVTATAEQAITVTAPVVIGALNDCTWAQIREISDAGQAANYWSIGDRKAETLNGTVGSLALNGTYYPFIVDFDHNMSKESPNAHTITFQFAKSALTGGADIAFVDGSYNSTGSSAAFRMNTTNTNSGGWTGSYMKKTLMPAFKSACSAALRAVIKPVTICSDNVGGGSNTASNVTASSEEFYLPAEFEVHGARSYANSAEQNYQTQLAYYKAGNSKVKYKHNATGTAAHVWCRSANCNYSTSFCRVSTSGGAASNSAYASLGVAPLCNV